MIEGRLVVDTSVMVSQAAEVRSLCNAVKADFQSMRELMNKTKNYWTGEAADLHRKLYDNQREDIDLIIRRIMEHPTDLEQMAGVYDEGERNNINASQNLPGDIL